MLGHDVMKCINLLISLLVMLLTQSLAGASDDGQDVFELGKTDVKCDQEQFRRMTDEVKKGNSNAEFEYGKYYYWGVCVQKNDYQSFLFFYKAAQKGHVQAYYNVALMYDLGIGVPVDKKQSAQLFESLLETRYPKAINYICSLSNDYGLDVTKWIVQYDLSCQQ